MGTATTEGPARAPGGRVVVVADRPADLAEPLAQRLSRLQAAGDEVVVVVRALPVDLPADADAGAGAGLPAPVVLPEPPPPPLSVRAARRLGGGVADDERLRTALRQPGGLAAVLRDGDAVVPAGTAAERVVPEVVQDVGRGAAVIGPADLETRLRGYADRAARQRLGRATEELSALLVARPEPSPESLTAATDALVTASGGPDGPDDSDGPDGSDGSDDADGSTPVAWDGATWRGVVAALGALVELKAWPTASRLLAAAAARAAPDDAEVQAELALLRAHVALTVHGRTDDDVVVLADALVPAMDAAVAAGDDERATALLSRALGLLFHRELHADVERTPLVEDPDAFLAPLRRSRLWSLLARPTEPLPREVDARSGTRPSVVVLPGSYGRFAVPLVTALEAAADVAVVDTTARRATVGFGTSRQVLRPRVRQAMGLDWEPDRVRLEAMEAADTAFVDWADRGALLSVMAAPEGVRVVLRVHSMDALSPWLHVLDWSRVAALVVVSEHVRDVVVRLLGDALARTEVVVVPNVVELHRFDLPKEPGAERVLAVVGWGQKVKDPLWALEVLALLRRDDPAWRLLLVGHDLRQQDVATTVTYTARFRARLAQPDVAGAVDFVPFTDDVPDVLRRAGYVVSSSVRESAPVGLTEGAASGAVPVVRDWPVFASVTGARRRFPEAWVVDTPAEAAARVSATQDVDDWRAASDATREEVRRLFGYDDVAGRMRAVVLGTAGST